VLCVGDGINETRDDSAALRIAVCLPCEVLAQGATGMIRQVWMFGERFQFTFHRKRNRGPLRYWRCRLSPHTRRSFNKRYGIVRYAVAHRPITLLRYCLLPVGLSIEPALIACVLGAAILLLQGKQNACRGYEEE
jgi:hypothetical protein